MPIVHGTNGIDNLPGTEGDDIIKGYYDNDTLSGLGGSDTLDGGKGADTMIGGEGNDFYYVDNVGDIVKELADQGKDRVYADINYTLPSHVEELFLTGSANLNGIGNNLNNYIYGNSGANILKGGGGDDDLDGAGGADTLVGGIGNDWYTVDHALDKVIENADEGTDGVLSWIDYALGANVENLQLAGAGNIDGWGNELDNRMWGNDGNNVLEGAGGDDWLFGLGGADTMLGGHGDDWYWVTDAADVVVEEADQGRDRIISTISTILPDDVEDLQLARDAGSINGTGNGLDNYIFGNAGNNVLKGAGGDDWLVGAGGNDTMAGGVDDDIYAVTDSGDVVIEKTDEGFDQILSHVSYTLPANVEALLLDEDAGNINGTGNELPNYIQGSNGNNVLTGGLGNDELAGMGGKDTLIGGQGGDWFYWHDAAATGTTAATADVIQDFSFVQGDRIHLSYIDADVYAAGDQAFTFIGAAPFSGTPGEIRYYQSGGNTYIEMQTGTAVDVEGVIRLNGIHQPEVSWFWL